MTTAITFVTPGIEGGKFVLSHTGGVRAWSHEG